MGAIHEMMKKTATIKRKSAGSGANSQIDIYATVSGSSHKGALREVTNPTQLFDASNYGNEYRWYCDESVNVLVDDILVIDTFEFAVRDVKLFEDEEDGSETHKRVILNKSNSNSEPLNP